MTQASPPVVLVVDDDPAETAMLATWLRHTGYETLVANTGIAALAALEVRAVDAVVTDLRMPGLDGLQLLDVIASLQPGTPVVFLTGQGTLEDAVKALRCGRAFDFLRKPLRDLRDLNVTLELAFAQRRQMLPAVGEGAGRPAPGAPLRPAPPVDGLQAPLEPLTATERRLLELLAQGHGNQEIAQDLCFSEKTVRNYLSRVYEKLGVDSRLKAVAISRQMGLIV